MVDLFYPGELSDGTVSLRAWAERDLACVEQASHDPAIPAGTTVPGHYTPAAGRAFIGRQHKRLTSGEGVSLAITDSATDEAAGLVILALRPQPGVAGIGYWIVPNARRRGMATRAVGLATGWGLTTVGFSRVEAWVEPHNTASQRTLEANGYLREGLLRSFLVIDSRRADVLVYARIAGDR